MHGSEWVTSTSITLIIPCVGGAVDNVDLLVLADVDGVGGRAGGKGQCSTLFLYFFYLLFNQTPVAEEQIMEFSGGEGACTQPT